MKIETMVYVTEEELREPFRLILGDGSAITIVLDRGKQQKTEPPGPTQNNAASRRWNQAGTKKLYCAPCDREFKYEARLRTHQEKEHGVKFIDGEDAHV